MLYLGFFFFQIYGVHLAGVRFLNKVIVTIQYECIPGNYLHGQIFCMPGLLLPLEFPIRQEDT